MSDAEAAWDVAIVGGGMVGASLALALAGAGRRVTLLEAQAPDSSGHSSFDERTTALSNGARRIFATLGIWEAIAAQAAPIRHIHISDAGRFGVARLDAAEHDLTAFGYTVGNRHLGAVLWQALQSRAEVQCWTQAQVRALVPEREAMSLTMQTVAGEQRLRARLIVAADGADSLVRRAAGIASVATTYEQVALVANVRCDVGAGVTAYERFTASGPLALLPRYDASHALIWTLPPAAAPALAHCGEDEFCSHLQQRFGWRAGRFLHASRRASYPLELVRARATVAERVALIGNAAQALHPVAAQGFNLGLRDAATLAELIAPAHDPGDPALLAEFARRRVADRSGMMAFTDRLVRLFGDQRTPIAAARNLGLLLFDLTPSAKRALSRLSWGFGALPRLSRGLPLRSSREP